MLADNRESSRGAESKVMGLDLPPRIDSGGAVALELGGNDRSYALVCV